MNNLIIAVVAWYIAEGSGLVQDLKHWLLAKKLWYKVSGFFDGKTVVNGISARRLKPLDCPMCLAFWIGTFFYYETHFCKGEILIDLITGFVNGIICSALAIFISKIYNRI